jgi:hypothetical protein
MAFRSANMNPPRGPRGGNNSGRGGGGFRGDRGSGYNTPNSAALTFDASGRVDQGFGPVGGVGAEDSTFDIFGIDDVATGNVSRPPPQPIL